MGGTSRVRPASWSRRAGWGDGVRSRAVGYDLAFGRFNARTRDECALGIDEAGQFQQAELASGQPQHAHPIFARQVAMAGKALGIGGPNQQRLAKGYVPGGKVYHLFASRIAGAGVEDGDAAADQVVVRPGRLQPYIGPVGDAATCKGQSRAVHSLLGRSANPLRSRDVRRISAVPGVGSAL